jgi:hypothetical protein
MVPISSTDFNAYVAKVFCRIVGFTCLAGFLIDLVALVLPPALGSVEWRIGLLQQLSDRSIVILLGAALSMYGMMQSQRYLRGLAIACLVTGISFHLSCILLFRDAAVLQAQTVNNISSQAAQLQSRIQQAQSDVDLPTEVTPEQMQQASQTVANQAEALRRNTRTGILRAGLASIGNLIVVGLGLIGLGRYGMQLLKG